ncbi:MAG: MaoC family dehydratase, partial [Actinomycetota bacterium]|nr:MaoC family dehydratase [Actinomycetota bacterium]
GAELPPGSFVVTRADLVRYAGASGDFNVIHWNQRVAQSVGLPDVIAHGMLTMALAARVVTDWVVDPAAVLEYSARFTRPVPVPDDDVGATLDVSAKVTERLDDRRARIELTATCGGDKVLGMARVLVQLS